jgi:hypothetical protein
MEKDAERVLGLLRLFLEWEPVVPKSIPELVELVAPLCRSLRRAVEDSLETPGSTLVELSADWKKLLFPDASDAQFADAYAQTVTYALLLARAEGASTLNLAGAVASLRADHTLLAKALEVLVDPAVRDELSVSLGMLQRVCDGIDPAAIDSATPDPWLYFYEDFLAAYDPKLRKDWGVYYTPVGVVSAQVRICQQLLETRFGKPLGFEGPSCLPDPAKPKDDPSALYETFTTPLMRQG